MLSRSQPQNALNSYGGIVQMGILNLTIPLSESPMWILGQYLSQLGLSTESRRPIEDGQRVRYYRLNTEDVEFIQKVLDYRQRQREDRERKRQESQERNAAYAARMQSQYGINAPLASMGAGGISPLHPAPCTFAFFTSVHTPH